MPEVGLSDVVVASSSRRGFLARIGRLLLAVSGGGAVAAAIKAERAAAFHFCGHIYTTGSCPHPTGLPRVDTNGFPLRASDGERVDDLGARIDRAGRPLDAHGHLVLDPDGRPLPRPRGRASVMRPQLGMGFARTSTVPGIGAATATSAGSSTAAVTSVGGSTATQP